MTTDNGPAFQYASFKYCAVRRVEEFVGDDNLRLDLRLEKFSSVSKATGPKRGLHSTVGVHLATDDGFERGFWPSKQNESTSLPGCIPGLQSLNRSQCHLVVVSVNGCDVLAVRLNEILHHLLGLGACEVAVCEAMIFSVRGRLDRFRESVVRSRATDAPAVPSSSMIPALPSSAHSHQRRACLFTKFEPMNVTKSAPERLRLHGREGRPES